MTSTSDMADHQPHHHVGLACKLGYMDTTPVFIISHIFYDHGQLHISLWTILQTTY
jgi:hypothetical protein